MSEQKARKKMLRFFVSLCKELDWLEQKALEGWFLTRIQMGVLYTFQKEEPRKMLYDVERFNLPQKPTLEDICQKDVFLEMAAQLGWEVVTHDGEFNYYFCKEYVEGDINELCNDEDSRTYRGYKFAYHYSRISVIMNYIICIFALVSLILFLQKMNSDDPNMMDPGWEMFVYIYVIICSIMSILYAKLSIFYKKEMGMSRQDWRKAHDPDTKKRVRKLIWTMKGLNKFLKKEEEEGWVLNGVTATSYSFTRNEASRQTYSMDSKWLVKKRVEARYGKKSDQRCSLRDWKDLMDLNNDWQIYSVREAEEKGWTFVCALENRAIIYKGNNQGTLPLNDEKYSRRLRGISLIGGFIWKMLIYCLLGGLVGVMIGYFVSH